MGITAAGHQTIISADCHAGASHETYREYLTADFQAEFDAWRDKYRNPFRDLQDGGRVRNWDNDRRLGDLHDDGIVAEVVFPNTVPPFFPSFVLFAPQPTDDNYLRRRAGVHAHNRWLKNWCSDYSDQRAGIGQVFLNNVDDAIEDAIWIHENGLRGGLLLPNIPPDCKHVLPLYDPCYDPFWAVCEERGIPINVHGGTGLPNYGKYPTASLLLISEVQFYSSRPFVQLLLSGVFERFPNLKFVMTEMGAAWLPPMLRTMDGTLERIRKTGRTGELRYSEEHVLPKSATDYFHQNCWMGISQPAPEDGDVRLLLGHDKFMWGSDYPHNEGTYPFTREHLRVTFGTASDEERNKLLCGNAADLYGFDAAKLEALADEHGPTVAELREPLTVMPAEPNEALQKAAHLIPA